MRVWHELQLHLPSQVPSLSTINYRIQINERFEVMVEQFDLLIT